MNIKAHVFKAIQNLTKQKFNENSNIYEIGIDSLDLIEVITDAETKLKITISDEQLAQVKTIKDVIVLIEEAIKISS